MGGISMGGGHGGKKSVDSEIPLVPFIDLLLCCIMFLLITAVWNQLAHLDINQQVPSSQSDMDQPPPEEVIRVYLHITAAGFAIASTAGERIEIPKSGTDYDLETLRERLHERREADAERDDIIVAPEDGIHYSDVIAAMDVAVGEGFREVSLSDGAAL